MSLRRSIQFALALAVGCLALAFANPAGAVDNPDYTAPAPSTIVQSSQPVPVRQQVATVPAGRQRLAITGSDSAQLAAMGAVLVLGGGAVLVARRRIAA